MMVLKMWYELVFFIGFLFYKESYVKENWVFKVVFFVVGRGGGGGRVMCLDEEE